MSAPGKIVFATPFESCLTHRGNRHPALARYLSEAGERVEYLTTTFDHALKRHSSQERVAEFAAALPYRLTAFWVPGYRRNISLARMATHILLARRYSSILRARLSPGDVVIAPSRPPELVSAVGAVARKCGAMAILDISDIWPDAFSGLGGLRYHLFRRCCEVYLRHGVPLYAGYIVTSPDFRDWLGRFISTPKPTFIPLGFDHDRWQICRPSAKPLQNGLSIAYVGLLQRQIELKPVVEALASRHDIQMTIIGDDGQGERFDQLIELLRARNIENVRMLGWLAADSVPGELARHDIGVVPMVSSSLPNKLFDYLGACLPMLALGENATSRLVREQGIGWTAPFEPEALGMVLDRITAAELREKAERVLAVRKDYDRDILHRKFHGVIAGLKGSPAKQAASRPM